ncbi:hypothetical protein E8E14_010275 [Neopestalotiopsis sp. 37M]|nr:hypothetical protein E8E14_010275 [Neopestalotiopsis sp. 37M]
MSPPSAVTPEAAFIAASAASQIVTSDCDSQSEAWFDQFGIEPSSETAMVTVSALQLANNFIDQLLFNIIGVAGSTSLAALRPAVSEVLKPKLAKDAISAADEELNEYLGGGEVDDLAKTATTGSPDDWDLELVWKRTRLRCMVYSSLGDMEEEDEDYHMEQEHLGGDGDEHPDSAVSPAVAIFLTSILEFMGEQVLIVAGQAALNRLRMRYEKDLKDGTRASVDESERIVVEELDMERVALDRTLGRLWRSWKKRIRSPTEPNFGRNSIRSATHSRRGSAATDAMQSLATPLEESMPREVHESHAKLRPSQIPLPIGSNDVAEIEVPGLVAYSDDEDSDSESDYDSISLAPRPKSLLLFSALAYKAAPALGLSEPQTPLQKTRRRSSSVPTPAASPYKSPVADKFKDAIVTDVNKTAEVSGLKVERQVNEDGVSPLDTSSADYIDGKTAAIEPSPVSAIVSSAVALGAAAVAGVAAMAQGSAPQTEPEPTPVDEDEIDDFGEEPEIMTSSRVSINGSIGGRSSPSVPETGRPLSIKLPARSNSLRSVRVIDVQSPRTPSIKSRAGSVDTSDVPPSRPTSSTPPIAEERHSSDNNLTARAIKNALGGEGVYENRNARDYHPSSSYESFKPPVSNAAPAVTSRAAPTSAPASYSMKSNTRNQSNAGRSFLDLDSGKPEIPERAPEHHRMPRMPVVPEQSAPAPSSPTYTRKRSADRNQPGASGSPESAWAAPVKVNDSPSSSSSNKYKPMRSSEDGSVHRPQDITKNFEELLQNDQTIQYTLTPENMRNMDPINQKNGGPTSHHKSRRSEDVKFSEQPRSSSSMSIKRSMSVSKATGLSSHPLGSHPMEQQSKSSKLTGPVPRAPPVSMGNYHNRASAQARDARVPRESVADFADFIRSTGPPGGKPAPPAKAPASQSVHSRSASGSVAPSASVELNRSRQGSVNRARLQARDAAVSASNESSDLIDFIRRGPPNAGNNPRIPRNVAPFRTTMDSDQLQMSGAGGGKAVDAVIPDIRHSRASTTVTDTSLPSSINSNSALLNKANKPAQYSNNFDDDDMMPKRKQRRVRDPYAIDFSDEEDDMDELDGDGLGPVESRGVHHIKEEQYDDDDDFDLDLAPRPKPKKEESLIDFLNSCEPPSAPSPPRPFITSQSMPKKKASAPNLMSRLRSAGGGSSSAAKSNGASANQPRAVSSQGGNPRGYTPINVTVPSGGATSYGSIQPPAPRVNNSSSGGRVLMKKYEPRDASSSAGMGRTSDLASFLRDSEPPPSTMASPAAQPQEKSSSGFSRVFERRKKSVY